MVTIARHLFHPSQWSPLNQTHWGSKTGLEATARKIHFTDLSQVLQLT
jgi:hypothetical protein